MARAVVRDGDLVVDIEEWLCVLFFSATAASGARGRVDAGKGYAGVAGCGGGT